MSSSSSSSSTSSYNVLLVDYNYLKTNWLSTANILSSLSSGVLLGMLKYTPPTNLTGKDWFEMLNNLINSLDAIKDSLHNRANAVQHLKYGDIAGKNLFYHPFKEIMRFPKDLHTIEKFIIDNMENIGLIQDFALFDKKTVSVNATIIQNNALVFVDCGPDPKYIIDNYKTNDNLCKTFASILDSAVDKKGGFWHLLNNWWKNVDTNQTVKTIHITSDFFKALGLGNSDTQNGILLPPQLRGIQIELYLNQTPQQQQEPTTTTYAAKVQYQNGSFNLKITIQGIPYNFDSWEKIEWYTKGNKEKEDQFNNNGNDTFFQTSPSHKKILLRLMKELGDKGQCIFAFIIKNYTNRRCIMMTCDKVVFITCILLGVECFYEQTVKVDILRNGVPKQITRYKYKQFTAKKLDEVDKKIIRKNNYEVRLNRIYNLNEKLIDKISRIKNMIELPGLPGYINQSVVEKLLEDFRKIQLRLKEFMDARDKREKDFFEWVKSLVENNDIPIITDEDMFERFKREFEILDIVVTTKAGKNKFMVSKMKNYTLEYPLYTSQNIPPVFTWKDKFALSFCNMGNTIIAGAKNLKLYIYSLQQPHHQGGCRGNYCKGDRGGKNSYMKGGGVMQPILEYQTFKEEIKNITFTVDYEENKNNQQWIWGDNLIQSLGNEEDLSQLELNEEKNQENDILIYKYLRSKELQDIIELDNDKSPFYFSPEDTKILINNQSERLGYFIVDLKNSANENVKYGELQTSYSIVGVDEFNPYSGNIKPTFPVDGFGLSNIGTNSPDISDLSDLSEEDEEYEKQPTTTTTTTTQSPYYFTNVVDTTKKGTQGIQEKEPDRRRLQLLNAAHRRLMQRKGNESSSTVKKRSLPPPPAPSANLNLPPPLTPVAKRRKQEKNIPPEVEATKGIGKGRWNRNKKTKKNRKKKKKTRYKKLRLKKKKRKTKQKRKRRKYTRYKKKTMRSRTYHKKRRRRKKRRNKSL